LYKNFVPVIETARMENKSVIRLPSVCVNRAAVKDSSLNDRHQMLFGTILNNFDKPLPPRFNNPKTGVLAAAPLPRLPSSPHKSSE
jgi:hypothetical protein